MELPTNPPDGGERRVPWPGSIERRSYTYGSWGEWDDGLSECEEGDDSFDTLPPAA